MPDQRHRIDHDEAYRDDPTYTAPEMQPGNGEDLPPQLPLDSIHVGTAAGLGIGFAGAAVAGDSIDEEAQDEIAATSPRALPTE